MIRPCYVGNGSINRQNTKSRGRGKEGVRVGGGLSLLKPGLPLVQSPADVAVAEIEVCQLVAEVHRLGEVARVGRPLGQQQKDSLSSLGLGRRQEGKGVFEIPLCQPPVVAGLEAVAELD